MTSQIPKLLDELRVAFISRGLDVDRYLQPGLAKDEMLSMTNHLPFDLPQDLIDLYTWRNGQTGDADWEPDAFLFRDNLFICLERALDEYELIQQHYGPMNSVERDGFDLDLCFPFATLEGDWYVLICGAHQLGSPHPHPVVCVFEGIELHYYSMESMLATCIAWVGHPLWTAESGLEREHELAIWKRHNPGIFE